jgi:hypothetical protein
MSVLSPKERHRHMALDEKLAHKKEDLKAPFDLIGCLDSVPPESAIPWFKAIGRLLARAGLSWRDISLMLREASRPENSKNQR